MTGGESEAPGRDWNEFERSLWALVWKKMFREFTGLSEHLAMARLEAIPIRLEAIAIRLEAIGYLVGGHRYSVGGRRK